MTLIRQGDVLLIQTSVKEDLVDAPNDKRGLVLAEGETSGHFHSVFGKSGIGNCKLYHFKDGRADRLLVVSDPEGASVRVVGGGAGGVDRHAPVDIGPGEFIVRLQRQFDSSYSRQVND